MKKNIYSTVEVKEFWKNQWDDIGTDYDRIIDYRYYPFTAIERYLPKDGIVLEAGCGTGRVLKGLHNDSYKVFGFDYDSGCVTRIKESGSYKVFCGDIGHIALKSDSVNTVLCFGVISCLRTEEDIGKAFSEIKRVLKKDGVLIVSLLNYNLLRRIQRYTGYLSTLFKKKRFHGWAEDKKGLILRLQEYFVVTDIVTAISRQPIYDCAFFLRAKDSMNRRLARVDDKEYRLNLAGKVIFNCFERYFPQTISGSLTFVCRKKA